MERVQANATLEEMEYPSSDGEPMAETGLHVLLMITLIQMLRDWYAGQEVYVIGNIFLYYEQGNNSARRSPDVMVVKGVPPDPERDSFKTWEERALPCVVIELTSNKTQAEDQGPKKELYQQLGVREYFLFDPFGDYLHRPLVGYRLIHRASDRTNGNGLVSEYEELLPAADGGMLSQELGLRLVPEGLQLTLVDFATGERLPTPRELKEQLEEQSRMLAVKDEQLLEEQKRTEDAARRAEDEQRRAEDERRRADLAEKTLAALREELARLRAGEQPGDAPSASAPP